ncbi:DUF6307 family protein [Amycolatopsis balhimycina]|uniref:DUF6307 family protein n=1 Tax=Amycolatopsis balhimycina TaxID=208443 RepID=UPI000F77B929|nr:DUF6307 family protein [Amycolatopsis balhimycina]
MNHTLRTLATPTEVDGEGQSWWHHNQRLQSGGNSRRGCSAAVACRSGEADQMSTEATYISRYDQRVKLVQGVLGKDTELTGKATRALAVRVLHTLDAIPEKVR